MVDARDVGARPIRYVRPEAEPVAPVGLTLLTSGAAGDQRLAESVVAHARHRPEVRPLAEGAPEADVVLVLARSLTEALLDDMGAAALVAANPAQCTVLVTGPISERQLARAIAAGVVSILPARAITPRQVVAAVLASSGGRSIIPEHATRWLVDETRACHELMRTEYGVVAGGLTLREAEVLRMLADGQDTTEIAEHLHYSERTIKKILGDLTARLHLRNRTHAVSYAFRVGAI